MYARGLTHEHRVISVITLAEYMRRGRILMRLIGIGMRHKPHSNGLNRLSRFSGLYANIFAGPAMFNLVASMKHYAVWHLSRRQAIYFAPM